MLLNQFFLIAIYSMDFLTFIKSKKIISFMTILAIIIILIIIYHKSNIFENFFWNYPTRFYPSYDLRGYYGLFPYNYPFFPYISPYYYGASGQYYYDPKYRNLLRRQRLKILSRK
jgi:hypothetical protein